MEIKKEDGKVITTMSFSKCFFGYDNPNVSKEIINTFDRILLSHPNQPERLNPEDAIKSVCDSLNTTNK